MSDLADLLIEHIGIISSATSEIKSTRGRSKINAGSLYGINKIRRLILDLALKGRLVKQIDHHELPQYDLKNKELFFDVLKNIPRSWAWGQLGEIASLITKGTTPTSIGYAYQTTGIRFIKVENISDGFINVSSINQYISEEADKTLSRSSLRENDLLFSIAGTIGRVGIVRNSDLPANTNQALAIIRGTHDVFYPPFLLRQLNSFVANQIGNKARGGAMNNVSLSDLSDTFLVIPPYEEQKRISEKVDELMLLCDHLEAKCISSQTVHKALVQRFLDRLLRAQTSEDLDYLWIETISFFEILFKSEESIEILEGLVIDMVMMPSRLSDTGNWSKLQLKEVINGMDSGWSPACLNSPSPSNSKWGVLKTTAVQYLDYLENENKELPDNLTPRLGAEVLSGDILFTRAGPANRVGITCYVKNTRPNLMISDKIIRFRAVEPLISGEFLVLCINSGDAANYLAKAKSGMAESQVNISQAKLGLTPISFPSLEEQKSIVSRVNTLLLLCTQLKSKLSESSYLQRKITDVLVDQAST